jgi:hypothetical protein
MNNFIACQICSRDGYEQVCWQCKKIEQLEQKLKIAVDALEFYGDIQDNYMRTMGLDIKDKARRALEKINTHKE